jgi:hypothetical protein
MGIHDILHEVAGLARRPGDRPHVVPGSPAAVQNAAEGLARKLGFTWDLLEVGTPRLSTRHILLQGVRIVARGATGYVYSRRLLYPGGTPSDLSVSHYEVGAIAEDELLEESKNQGRLTAHGLCDALEDLLHGETVSIKNTMTKLEKLVASCHKDAVKQTEEFVRNGFKTMLDLAEAVFAEHVGKTEGYTRESFLADDREWVRIIDLFRRSIRKIDAQFFRSAGVFALVRAGVRSPADFETLVSSYGTPTGAANAAMKLAADEFFVIEPGGRVSTIRREITGSDAQPKRVPWRLLPPGEHPFQEILNHYEVLEKQTPSVRYDRTRLERIYELSPTAWYVGLDEFSGYIVFYFQESQTAVLDNPAWGNAIYVIRGEWESLSRLTKAQLLAKHKHTQRVRKIVHSGDWFQRLTMCLQSSGNSSPVIPQGPASSASF